MLPALKFRPVPLLLLLGMGTLLFLLLLPPLLPGLLGRFSPQVVFAVEGKAGKLYLTIDDGPSRHTDEILAVLAKHQVHATFFITGDHIASLAQLNRIRALGHTLGNHLKTTRACSDLTLAEFQRDFDFTARLLERSGPSMLFRPPSDTGTAAQRAYAQQRGYLPVAGTVFPLDHWFSRPFFLRKMIRWLAIDGGIIILHDGDERGTATAVLLDQVIPRLKAAGYRFGDLEMDISPRRGRP